MCCSLYWWSDALISTELKQLIHTYFHGAQPMPQPSCPQNLPSYTHDLLSYNLWITDSFSPFQHTEVPMQTASQGCLFSQRIHMTVTHCIVLAIFNTLNSSWPTAARLWEPIPDFPVLFEAILWLYLLYYINSHWALIYDLEEDEKKGGKHLWEQGSCGLNLSLSKPKLTAQLCEAERRQCQNTQPMLVRASTE